MEQGVSISWFGVEDDVTFSVLTHMYIGVKVVNFGF